MFGLQFYERSLVVTELLKWVIKTPARTSGLTGVILAWIGFVSNIGGVQQYMCGQAWFRPICSTFHMSGVAGFAEQAAWDRALKAQTCDGYRSYITEFSQGEFITTAHARLTAARRIELETWAPGIKTLPLLVLPLPDSAEDQRAAQNAALQRGETDAQKMLCKPFANGNYRLMRISVAAETWNCRAVGEGVVCGFEGVATCHVEERTISVDEDCSVKP